MLCFLLRIRGLSLVVVEYRGALKSGLVDGFNFWRVHNWHLSLAGVGLRDRAGLNVRCAMCADGFCAPQGGVVSGF